MASDDVLHTTSICSFHYVFLLETTIVSKQKNAYGACRNDIFLFLLNIQVYDVLVDVAVGVGLRNAQPFVQ